jgi:hypothetical protein
VLSSDDISREEAYEADVECSGTGADDEGAMSRWDATTGTTTSSRENGIGDGWPTLIACRSISMIYHLAGYIGVART